MAETEGKQKSEKTFVTKKREAGACREETWLEASDVSEVQPG